MPQHLEGHARDKAPERQRWGRQLVLPPALLHADMHAVALVDRRGIRPAADGVQGAEGQVEAGLEMLQPAGI